MPVPNVEDPHVLSDLERLLRERGCPSCRYVGEAERSFFSWFEIESFSAVEMHARLRAAIGMCPAHSRRLVDQLGEGHIMTTVAREALAGASQAARGELRPGPCPACETVIFASERARHVLVDGLLEPGHARRYEEHEGLCLPHAVQAARTAEVSTLRLLAERLLATLDDEAAITSSEPLAGIDDAAGRRASWRQRLPEQSNAGSTIELLCRRLELEACPVCLSTGLAECRYTRWFTEGTRQDDPSLRTDPGELCPAHLHDIAVADRSAARQAAERKRAGRMGELHRLLDRLAELPVPARRGRRAGPEDLDRARGEFLSAHHCAACHARQQIERAQLELLVASLSLAPVRERYERGHGLCVHHALRVTAEPSSRWVLRHLDARVGVLSWELRETARKYAWACRHEPSGPEQDAWLRALVQLDGRVFEGGPAPVAEVGTAVE